MWLRYPGKHRWAIVRRRLALAGFGLILGITAALAAEEKTPPPVAPAASEVVFMGKFFCSVKRAVILPFTGIITSQPVPPGQRVKAGEILARYRLAPEAVLQVRRRLFPPQIKDLEMKLAEVERNLPAAEGKNRELAQLAPHKLAPTQALALSNRELQHLQKERAAIQEHLRQEQQLAQDDRLLLQELLGRSLPNGRVPREAVLLAPMDGYVIFAAPDLRPEAELRAGALAFQIGVMDPMLVRAQVHEVEAAQLTPGDVAELSLESRPERKVEARLSRLSWQSLRPEPDQPAYYEVEFSVPNPHLTFKEGMKVRIALRKSR